MRPIVAFLALAGLISSACAPITAPTAVEPAVEATPVAVEEGDSPLLEGVTWQLTEFLSEDGTPTPASVETTLTLQAGKAGGNTGCNNFSASYTLAGEQLTFGQAMSTMMACPEPAMTQEGAVLTNLGRVTTYALEEGQLRLLDAAGQTLLVFAQQKSASLTGVTWQATNYNNGKQAVVNVLADTQITALFGEDGSLAGSAGCNNYRATYTVQGNQITISAGAMTRKLCNSPAGVMEQETAYGQALTTAATYTIQGNILELRTADGALVARYTVASQ